MTLLSKRNQMLSLKVSEEEKSSIVAMAKDLKLPMQEILISGGFKEARRLLYLRNLKKQNMNPKTG